MQPIPLHFVWQYNDVDRAFWRENLEDWVPRRIIDAHTHVASPALRRQPMTPDMRRQHWVSEVSEPIDAADAEALPGDRVPRPAGDLHCLRHAGPGLGPRGEQCLRATGVHSRLVQPGVGPAPVDRPESRRRAEGAGVLGVKPYYALISHAPLTRDAHLEASIFEFLPHHILEVLDARHAWVTLHVPRAARLGDPDNLREIREIRRRYPNLVLVIAHLGRCYTEAHARAGLLPLADDPGIYFDTSAVINPASHRLALEHLGPERLLYGTDNPVFYMRGRRQYRGTSYVNRTNHDFHFNTEREPPEIEAGYTLFLYEDLLAMKQACCELGIERRQIEALFHDNAAGLIRSILARKKDAP